MGAQLTLRGSPADQLQVDSCADQTAMLIDILILMCIVHSARFAAAMHVHVDDFFRWTCTG
jgi:hypothetical protein